jgi:hypothetical protein
MRCRSRDGPRGSHQLEARASKWEISAGDTDEAGCDVDDVVETGAEGAAESNDVDGRGYGLTPRGAARRRGLRFRPEVVPMNEADEGIV